ncbi:MAG: hypothetical protein L0Z50_17815 [Verrucomicrobiales bacterium]|nr:hypothetical protein [Verrucomicrobiales bacterium]
MIGHVYASEKGPGGANQPLRNVTVTVDGAEETLRTVTDANGFFKLQPAPAGRFFVHVDGRTAVGSEWPDGAYYPFVGKAWEAVVGRTNNLASGTGEIFLPLIPSGALQAISATEETLITFGPSVIAANPALAGVEVRIPPNALFSENGTRGGKVGIVAVPPDRLPEPLPPGLDLPLVITIQTDGPMNFDRPVPVRFPNLPDPVTGEVLPPGAKSALWSFNHDTGRWEIQGPMTVTSDGLYVESDPGVGVRQPGWHGTRDGSQGNNDDPPRDDDYDDHDGNEEDNNDPDDADPCKKKRLLAEKAVSQCGLSKPQTPKLFGFVNFIPGIGCVTGLGSSIVDASEECDIDRDRCWGRYTSEVVSGVLNCLPGVGGVASKIWDCVLDAGHNEIIYKHCLQTVGQQSRTLALHVPPVSLPVENPEDLPDNIFYEQAQLWADAAALYALVLGSPKWTVIDPDDWPYAATIFEALQDGIQTTSTGGERITESERNEILQLTRPANITVADLSALVGRFDKIMVGGLPRQEFDGAAVGAAAAKLEATTVELQSRGWQTVFDAYYRGLTQLSADEDKALGGGGGASQAGLASRLRPTQTSSNRQAGLVRTPLFYRLTDMFGGFVRYGRLSDLGTLDSLIVASETLYEISYFDPASVQVGRSYFISGSTGTRFKLPRFILVAADRSDADGDGAPDEGELIVGTNPSRIDTDGDGVGDWEELRNGSNPLDGVSQALGPIASVGVVGQVVNLAVQNDMAVVIGPDVRLTFLNVSNPQNPVLVSRFEEVGDVEALAVMGRWLMTGHHRTGLTLLDIADVTKPTVLWRPEPRFEVTSVALGFGHAYAAGDRLRVFDLFSGELVSEVRTNGYGSLTIAGDRLYAIRPLQTFKWALAIFKLEENGRQPVFDGGIELTGEIPPTEATLPLFVADGYAYVGDFEGCQVVDVRDPKNPVLMSRPSRRQAVNHSIALDGAGLRAAVTSFAGESTLQAGIYDATSPTVTTNLLAGFDTPGTARKLALYRGRMLVADGSAGLTIANYRASDLATNPPTVSVSAYSTILEPAIQESGAPLRAVAQTRDDVVVREVEFHIDGQQVAVVGSYPFETDLPSPQLSPEKRSFVLQARAFDTAGNSAWSAPLTILLTNELRAPFLTAFTPLSGARYATGSMVQVTASFNEPIAPSTLESGWTLSAVGADGIPGTADDGAVPTIVSQSGPTSYTLEFAQPLPQGLYAVRAGTNLTDAFGNQFSRDVVWEFGIRPVISFIGPGNVWSQTATTRTNWSSGTIPTVKDFVEIDLSEGRELQVRQNVAAEHLIGRSPLVFGGGGSVAQLTLGERATFEKGVTMDGQITWTGGDSTILNELYISGLGNNSFINHILNNHGRVVLDKGGNNGLILRGTVGQRTVIRNLLGAAWEHLGGSIIGPGGSFENHGLFIKRGINSARVQTVRFVNLGTVEVQEGTLDFISGLGLEEHQQHAGSYLVKAGARLVFTSSGIEYSPTTRIFGGGEVEFTQTGDEQWFPGTLEVSGTVLVTSANVNFGGIINTTGPWKVGGPTASLSVANLTGPNPSLTGPVSIERNGALHVRTPAPLRLTSLTVSNELWVDTALEVSGPLLFEGGRLLGLGRLRANGPASFEGTVQGAAVTQGPVAGHFEIAGSATCGSNATVQVNGYNLTVLSGGSLDFVDGKEFRIGRTIVNDGSILKTVTGTTRVSNGIRNGGLLRVTDGSLDIVGPLIQTGGRTTLGTTGIVFSVPCGLSGDRYVDIQGGRFEGFATVTCSSVTNAAVMAPGAPIGTLDFQVGTHPVISVYKQTPSGVLLIDIAGTEAGLEHDQLKISGRAVLDGRLEIAVTPEYDPPLGQEFTILTANRVEGRFSSVQPAGLAGGKRLEVIYDNTSVKLRVVSI